MSVIDDIPTQRFIRAVLDRHGDPATVKLVVVTHIVAGTDAFLESVHKIMPVAAVIPKPNSIDPRALARVRQTIPVLFYTRSDILKRTDAFTQELRSIVGDSQVAIIDTGGYFSTILESIRCAFGPKLLAIIEDTENGHQKYEAAMLNCLQGKFPCPVISVARSDLKEPEDFLVGQAIVFSADALLREHGKLITGRRALVLGYGKIGRSIAQSLHSKAARVDVIDINSARQVLALAHGFHTDSKELLLRSADLIFCATGNQSIRRQNIGDIKRGAYLFMATSADDEIEELFELTCNGVTPGSGAINQVEIDGNRFFLCNNGNAVNFVHGGVVGPFIKLVQAELVYAVTQASAFKDLDRINRLNDDSRRFITELWLEHFIKG